MKAHETYMQRCIDLAENGLGRTYPNPMVGSVIVLNDTIIGEGWHRSAGKPHAEVNAIESVTSEKRSLLSEATLYVSLEPCSHYGKTPPCTQMIIKHGIRKVVVGVVDPNPLVAGKGIAMLAQAGCEVIVGVLEKKCHQLNKRFFTFQQKKRPYIILKWAQTANKIIAPKARNEKAPVWITNNLAQQRSHMLRAQEQSIIVGTRTVIDDNPSLTTRNWKGNSPLRVILDRTLRASESSKIYDNAAQTLIFTEEPKKNSSTNEYQRIEFSKNLAEQICSHLYDRNIQSLIVEGGRQTLQTFIDAACWDEAWVFESSICFENGVAAPEISGDPIHIESIRSNRLTIYKPLST